MAAGNQSGYGGNQVGNPNQGSHGSHGSAGPAQQVGMANQEGGMDKQLGTHYQQGQGQQGQSQGQGQQGDGYQWGRGLGSGFGSGFHDSRQVSCSLSFPLCCVCRTFVNAPSEVVRLLVAIWSCGWVCV